MRRAKKTKPKAVAAAGVADSTSMVEPSPPPPPEHATSPAPPPAPVPPAAVLVEAPAAHVQVQAQPKKRGRPPDTWLQIQQKKLKKMEDAFKSAERDCALKLEKAEQRLNEMYTIEKPEPLSLERRRVEKHRKRQRKVDELERAWMEAVEKCEVEKQLRASRHGPQGCAPAPGTADGPPPAAG